MVSLGSHGSTSFYVCGNAEGDCPRAAQQDAFDGRKAFSDFILFVYEAATVPSSTGGGVRPAARSSIRTMMPLELDAPMAHIIRGILMVAATGVVQSWRSSR